MPGTGHVLMIGDESGISNLVVSRLRAEGFEVTGASDGIEGEQRALADDVTLVVLDRMVSGGDCLDLLRVVRQRKPALPIIVVSARAEVADRIAAFDAGASDFLATPFSPGELVARVRAQLRRAGWA